MKYKWLIKETLEISKEFLEVAFNSQIIANLLLNRGINSLEKAKSYLNPRFYVGSKPEEIPDLLYAKDRIIEAINNEEKITIYGDYDVDGVTSTSCLLITLRQFTNNIDFYIPNRLSEGYGLNIEAVKTIAIKNKTRLLITCDCGITNHKEIELANELGMDVIVTDHHSLPEVLPPAHAVLNPKLLPQDHKLHYLPGVGVAYKLAEAILETEIRSQKSEVRGQRKIIKENLLDLVALGMIADLAPLIDENRYLVQIGLEKLANTEKVGLRELLRMCNFLKKEPVNHRTGKSESTNSPTTDHVGFGIAPRINAVGRLTDAASAVKLLTTSDLFEAVQIATDLEVQNRERQVLCEQTLNDAVEMIRAQCVIARNEVTKQSPNESQNEIASVALLPRNDVATRPDKCIVLAKEEWHHGVIGIVASRLVEKYSLPTILIAIDKEQNIARGSGRSVEQLNIVDALVANSKHLEKYGGHKAACGLSLKLENITSFILDFKNHVNNLLDNCDLEPVLKIDLELPLADLNINLLTEIYKLSPFGLGNPIPVFVSEEVEIVGIKSIGKNNQHLKLVLKPKREQNNVIARNKVTKQSSDIASNKIASSGLCPPRNDVGVFEALIWNYDTNLQFNLGDKIKIAYTPKLNSYNGETFIQLEVKDWQKAEVRSQRSEVREEKHIIEVYDFRGKTQECLNIFSSVPMYQSSDIIYFAEVKQQDYLPLKTYSRGKITKAEKLVFLEIPPDEIVLLDIIKTSCARKIYFAFDEYVEQKSDFANEVLRRLIGMLRYAEKNRNSRINEVELQAALGLNKSAFAFALEILTKVGFLSVERINEQLIINIFKPSRQNFSDLIEYKLFVSELIKILEFKGFVSEAPLSKLIKLLEENKIGANIISKERLRV